MTEPHPDEQSATRPISVAELLARNGNIGSPPVTGRRRRRRGNSHAVTVAELTGEIPVIRDEPDRDEPAPDIRDAPPASRAAGPAPEKLDDDLPATTGPATARSEPAGWSEPGPRWPESPPQPRRDPGPERSHYPLPVRQADSPDGTRGQQADRPATEVGAEQMSPDPVDDYAGIGVDVMDADVHGALSEQRAVLADDEAEVDADLDDEPAEEHGRLSELISGGAIVLQSILAVVFGAGLFIAFDQLWRWNNIVALVLTVLVTLGLVAAVQAVRKTVDIGSTLIAVGVGLLITLGPLALHAN